MNARALWTVVLLGCLGLSGVAVAQGLEKAKPSPAAMGAKAAKQGAAPAAPVKAKDKIRDGAYLRKDLPLDRKVDLRSVYEKARDAALITHYGRLAELDWIETLATKGGDNRLLERVDAVRRKEAKRFSDVMMGLREQARARELVGFP